MAQSQPPFSERTVQKLMRISGCTHFREHSNQLPPCWTILYALTDLSVEKFKEALGRTIRPDMERRMVVQLVKGETDDTKSDEAGADVCETFPEQRILISLFAIHSELRNNPTVNVVQLVDQHERRNDMLKGAVAVHKWLGSFIKALTTPRTGGMNAAAIDASSKPNPPFS